VVASDAGLQMQQNLLGCSLVFISAASPHAPIPALFDRVDCVIVDGDLVVVSCTLTTISPKNCIHVRVSLILLMPLNPQQLPCSSY
jgi:hypothetical protein